ncbi:tryptophan--tRNA ligase [Candidatus Woesearchaeota archaeon]|nr:tryptophan--tRNA ligase [Candidatus Woesearchaeota archaeon]
MNDPAALKKIIEDDYNAKLALKQKEESYYPEKLKEFGLKSIDRFVSYHPNPSKFMKFGITFGHKDLEIVADAIANNKPWAIVSGLNPSSPLHFGHKAIFDELLWLQQQGADLFIPITNDETYLVGKADSLAKARKTAYEDIIPSIIAMGFNPEKTHIYVDSDYPDIYNVAMDVSRKLTLNKLFGVFGWDYKEQTENPGKVFYMGGVQLAQILLPQYPEFGGPKPTIIPVGIDQHPYILLARDIAEKKGFIPPAEIDLKFLMGLDGKGKMSKSREGSAILLTDTPEEAEKKLRKAYTGGSVSGDFQRQHGGIPGICPVYGLRMYHFEKDNSLEKKCKTGETLCGQCKKEATEQVKAWLADHQRKLPEARTRINDFLLKTPIRSIFE